MPYLSFRFKNSDPDQTFTVTDQRDSSKTIFSGAVNEDETSAWIQCWQGSDGKGRVVISGSIGPNYAYDIPEDNYEVSYP